MSRGCGVVPEAQLAAHRERLEALEPGLIAMSLWSLLEICPVCYGTSVDSETVSG